MIQEQEPLRSECAHFVECIKSGDTPRSSGEVGARVTRILSAAQQSLRNGNEKILIDDVTPKPELVTGRLIAKELPAGYAVETP